MPLRSLILISALFTGFIIIWIWAYHQRLRRGLHLLQLEDYSPRRMLGILLHRRKWFGSRLWSGGDLLLLAALLVALKICFPRSAHSEFPRNLIIILSIIGWTAINLYHARWLIRKLKAAKKPLVLTARAKRILAAAWVGSALFYLVLFIIPGLTVTSFIINGEIPVGFIHPASLLDVVLFIVIGSMMLKYGSVLFITLAVNILRPFEWLTQRRYLKEARNILQEMKPLVIGITGSYGKTGTKEILSALLAEKFNVFRPPGSYNTLMGVTRVVREGLRPYHEVFIVEMGAYRVGSIAKLCNLTNPQYGIITTIGVQHLERFKSPEAIKQAKSELIRALPADGIAVLNGDNQACREIGGEYGGEVIYFRVEAGGATPPYPPLQVGGAKDGFDLQAGGATPPYPPLQVGGAKDGFDLQAGGATPPYPPLQVGGAKDRAALQAGGESDRAALQVGGEAPSLPPPLAGGELKGGVFITDIILSLSGSDFNIQFPNGEMMPFHLPLLGRAAISNAAAAVALADRLGAPRTILKAALNRLPQVRHRLELIPRSDGVIILDDAFNSNPIGATGALEVLAKADSGRRILVTPGMVELGSMEAEANYQFGRQAAAVCHLVVLIGLKRIEPIRRGLLQEGFDPAAIWTAPSLSEGLDRLQDYLKPGDVVLLENDLPDQYEGA